MATPKRLGILANEKSWYFRELAQAAAEQNAEVSRLGFPELAVELPGRTESPQLSSSKEDDRCDSPRNISPRRDQALEMPESFAVPELDVVIARTMPVGSLEQVIFRMDTLRIWQTDGIRIINSPLCLETCIDKLLTFQELRKHRIDFPRTIACQTAGQALDAYHRLGGDIVVKPIFGGEGRGIMRVCEDEIALRVFKTLEAMQTVIYCQEFVDNIVKDIRVMFVGEKSFAMLRSNHNHWIKNASLGGEGQTYLPSSEELSLAYRAAKAIGGDVVGVDLLSTDSGELLVLEVNAVPGWQLLEKVHDIKVADEVIRYAVS